MVDHTPLRLSAGASGSLLRLAARDPAPSSATGLAADLTIHTDLADYTLPLFMYSGRLLLVRPLPRPSIRLWLRDDKMFVFGRSGSGRT